MTRKYDALSAHLRASAGDSLRLEFSEVEAIVGTLPASARKHREWWSNSDSHIHARTGWLAAGWKTTKVDMDAERLTFVRAPSAEGIGGGGASQRPPAAVRHHDGEQSAFARIERRAGGAANLLEILSAVERYVEGEIVETELGRVVRRFWGRTD